MSNIKVLPDNLKELENDTEFKKVYKQFTTAQFEDKLTEAGVEYLNGDDKGDLTWRWLDHKGYDFEAANNTTDKATNDIADNKINGDEPAKQAISANNDGVDANGGDTDASGSGGGTNDPSKSAESVTSTNKGDSNENMEDEAPKTNDTQGDDATVTGNVVGQVDGASSTQTDSASTSDSQEDSGMVDTTVPGAPSDSSNGNDATTDKANQSAKTDSQPTADSSAPDHETATETPVIKHKYVEVKNSGSFNMLEPATGTLVVAGETTKIYIKGYVSKDQVLRNIEQYNHTRGKKLTVTN